MERTKFSDVTYDRPAVDDLLGRFDRLARAVESASSSESVELLSRWLKLDARWTSARTLCEIGFSRDMRDARFAGDKRFFDEHDAHVRESSRRAVAGLLEPPHVDALVREHGAYFVDFLGSELRLASAGLSDRMVEERALVTRQELLCADESLDGPALQDELDGVFDELVTIRARMAATLGLETYVPLGYRASKLLSITPEQVTVFRDRVREVFAPWFREVHAVRESLEADPRLPGAGMADFPVDAFREVFGSLSPEIGAFYERSLADGWFDVDDRPGMRPWSEAYMPAAPGRPFVFVKLTGAWGDVPEFIHETGHGFWFWTVAHDPRSSYVPTAEVDEIPSKALVYLTLPWMESVLGADADLYRFRKYHAGLYGLIYSCCIDEFECFAYEHPECGIEERNRTWDAILDRYGLRPLGLTRDWRSWEVPFGGPFHTVTYALSELASEQLWMRQAGDPDAATESYLALCRRSLDLPFLDLLGAADLRSPFDESLCADLVDFGREWLASIEGRFRAPGD
jgi:hypothetical protein